MVIWLYMLVGLDLNRSRFAVKYRGAKVGKLKM